MIKPEDEIMAALVVLGLAVGAMSPLIWSLLVGIGVTAMGAAFMIGISKGKIRNHFSKLWFEFGTMMLKFGLVIYIGVIIGMVAKNI